MTVNSSPTPRQPSAIYRCEGCGELVVGRDIVDDGHGRTEWDADHYARPVLCGPVSTRNDPAMIDCCGQRTRPNIYLAKDSI